MTVIKITSARMSDDPFSLQAKIECYQIVLRDWGNALDPFEQIVVLQIIDRTIGWGRPEAYFTGRAMLKGDNVYAGMKVGHTKLYAVLQKLESIGLVVRRKDASVADRVHFSVNMAWKPGAESASNGLQPGATPIRSAECPVRVADYPVRVADTIHSTNPPVSPNSIIVAGATAPLPFADLENVRERVEVASRRSPAALSRKATSPEQGVNAVEAAWRLAQNEFFPGSDCPAWGVRERAQAKSLIYNWRGKGTLAEFATWAITNWTAIIKKNFKWMTKAPPPAVPALSFFTRFITQFAECRAEGVLEKWQSSPERTRLEQMMARGQTYEQANARIAKEDVAVTLRDEVTKRERNVTAFHNGATRKLEQARKLAESEGRMPIHPMSPNAIRMRAEAAHAPPAPVPEGEKFTGAEVFFVDPTRNPFDVD